MVATRSVSTFTTTSGTFDPSMFIGMGIVLVLLIALLAWNYFDSKK